MNTPEPCDTCANCEYDPLDKDKPNASAWCYFKHKMGDEECMDYSYWKKRAKNEKASVPKT